MSQLINNEQKLLEIIFAGRNKEYGAYAIRSSYGSTVFKSLSIMIISVGTIASIAAFLSNKNQPPSDMSGQVPIQDSTQIIFFESVEEEKPEPLEPETEKPAQAASAKPDESNSTRVSDSVFTDKSTDLTNTLTIAAATSTVNTGITGEGTGSVVTKGSSTLTGIVTDEVKLKFEVDSDAVFDGGLPALYRFISSNLKYPAYASEYGKEGTVYVKFVVDEKGQVGRLSLLNSIGYGMDDEALRVISLLPKFKSPAKVKGTPVKVYYQMPIRFRFR